MSTSIGPEHLGVVEGQWTPGVARLMGFVTAHMTPQDGEGLFRELGRMQPSKSSLDRVPKRLGERWEAEREVFEASLREALVPENATTVAGSLDGVMMPMKDGERAAKRARARTNGKRTKDPAGYQETACATLSFFDAQGERLETTRLARMPEPPRKGIAASTASGVQVFLAEGAWSKCLHPGGGAVGGITRARLGEHGFVAPARPCEGRYGLSAPLRPGGGIARGVLPEGPLPTAFRLVEERPTGPVGELPGGRQPAP